VRRKIELFKQWAANRRDDDMDMTDMARMWGIQHELEVLDFIIYFGKSNTRHGY